MVLPERRERQEADSDSTHPRFPGSPFHRAGDVRHGTRVGNVLHFPVTSSEVPWKPRQEAGAVEDDLGLWKEMTLEERIQQRYRVDGEMAHRIAQKYLNLALIGLEPGTTIREAYTSEERQKLLDEAADTVRQGFPKQT